MNYIDKNKKKELFDSLQERHGSITKVLDINGQPFAYVVRCEASNLSTNHPIVLMNISFNRDYEVKDGHFRSYKQSDLKFFAIKKALDYDVKTVTDRSTRTPFVLDFKVADENLFKLGARTIVDAYIEGAKDGGCFIGMELDYDKQRQIADDSSKYILSKVLSIVEYYKNKEFTVIFI